MKRNLIILIFCATAMAALCQNNDTIWSDDFSSGKLDETYWNYENKSIYDLILYRPENVVIQTIWNIHTGCHITCKYDYYEGYRFTSGGVDTQHKIHIQAGQKLDFVAAMPTGEYAFGEQYMDGQLAKLLLTNVKDTIGFVFNTDAPQSLHAVLISNGNVLSDNYINVTYPPFDFHKFSVALDDEEIIFYIDDTEFSSYKASIANSEYWICASYDVAERGQPIAREEDCASTEDFFVECYPREYSLMIKKVSVTELTKTNADYKPVLVEGKKFTYAVFASYNRYRVEYKEIFLHETTNFNDLLYWVEGDNLLREDIENQRVYIIPKYAQGNTTEYLLYDFGVNEGDEIRIFQPLAWYEEPMEEFNRYFLNESNATVTEVALDGDRKRIEVYVQCPADESVNDGMVYDCAHLTWVEGIGNKYTLLCNDGDIPDFVASRSKYLLLCVSMGDELIYRTGAGATYGCDGLNSALEEVPAEELLNISGNVLTLKGTYANAVSAIFSADGRQVMSFTGGTADISSLPQGLYVLLTAANGTNLTAKFVK